MKRLTGNTTLISLLGPSSGQKKVSSWKYVISVGSSEMPFFGGWVLDDLGSALPVIQNRLNNFLSFDLKRGRDEGLMLISGPWNSWKWREPSLQLKNLNRYSLHDLRYARSCFAHLTLFPLTVQIPRVLSLSSAQRTRLLTYLKI